MHADVAKRPHERVAARGVLAHHLAKVFGRRRERSHGRVLVDRGWRKARLSEAQRSATHGLAARDERADARAAGAVALRDRVDHDAVLGEIREPEQRRRTAVLGPVVHEIAVDLVADVEEAFFAAELRQNVDLGSREHYARGVAGRAEHQSPRARRDRRAHPLWVDAKAVTGLRGHGPHTHAEHVRKAGVVRVVRLGNEQLVPWNP